MLLRIAAPIWMVWNQSWWSRIPAIPPKPIRRPFVRCAVFCCSSSIARRQCGLEPRLPKAWLTKRDFPPARQDPTAATKKSPAGSTTRRGKGTGRLHVWETKRLRTPLPAHKERERWRRRSSTADNHDEAVSGGEVPMVPPGGKPLPIYRIGYATAACGSRPRAPGALSAGVRPTAPAGNHGIPRRAWNCAAPRDRRSRRPPSAP